MGAYEINKEASQNISITSVSFVFASCIVLYGSRSTVAVKTFCGKSKYRWSVLVRDLLKYQIGPLSGQS